MVYKCEHCEYECKKLTTKINHEYKYRHEMRKYFDVEIQELELSVVKLRGFKIKINSGLEYCLPLQYFGPLRRKIYGNKN